MSSDFLGRLIHYGLLTKTMRSLSILTYVYIEGKRLEDIVDQKTLLELSHNEMLIMNKDIRLLDCVGQGNTYILCSHSILFIGYMYVGEFGLVYKAHLFNKDGVPEYVAVKTLKGTVCMYTAQYCIVHLFQ